MATLTIEQESFTPLDQIPLPIPLQPLASHHESQHQHHPSSPTPPRDQPVFEASRLEPLHGGQRIAVTVLLITANIVQVSKRSRFQIPPDQEAGEFYRNSLLIYMYPYIYR
jgi:hypothetical protein